MSEGGPQPHPGTPVDGVEVLGALSPSRASDFRACPLRYRLRTIDRLPEEPSPAAVRGSVVHKVLEDLFDLPAPERTPERAAGLVEGAWEMVQALEPEAAAMFGDDGGEGGDGGGGSDLTAWLASCRASLSSYFDLEDPRRLEPVARELYVETLLDSKLLLRGIVDRIDEAPDGALRVVDYKTGRSPGVGFEASALFQMRFYALVLWRTRGVMPRLLQLIYLGDGQLVGYRPDEDDLRATERLLEALWEAIRTARETGEWLPRRSGACGWCSFQAYCPEFGGTTPPLPDRQLEAAPSDEGGQGGEVGGLQADQALAPDPAPAAGHLDVVGHHEHRAARGLG